METAKIIYKSGIPLIWAARMCKSGSATQIKTPIRNETITITISLFVITRAEPTFSPIGINDISTPRLNREIPKIMKTTLTINRIMLYLGISIMVRFNKTTSANIVTTERKDSFNLANKSFLNQKSTFPNIF